MNIVNLVEDDLKTGQREKSVDDAKSVGEKVEEATPSPKKSIVGKKIPIRK
jgi:hypothetical protein